LGDLQARIADRVFPKVESVLNELRGHLETFMSQADRQLASLQRELTELETEHELAGLEPIALAAAQTPLLDGLRRNFQSLGEQERDGIVSKLDAFVTEEVEARLDEARARVTNVWGSGTTVRQDEEVSAFYRQIRTLLAEALRSHLDRRIREFAEAILKNAESVGPRIREGSEGVIQERVDAIKSSLAVATEGKKEQVAAYLGKMVALFRDFAANPEATAPQPVATSSAGLPAPTAELAVKAPEPVATLSEQHYVIADGATGYTYERIFRPYIDDAVKIIVGSIRL
jgi:hypothetical protein